MHILGKCLQRVYLLIFSYNPYIIRLKNNTFYGHFQFNCYEAGRIENNIYLLYLFCSII